MIEFALILMLQVPTALTHEAVVPPENIEVMGRRLEKLRLDLAMNDNRLKGCRVSVSSGDRFIDDQACKGAYSCVSSGVVESRTLLRCINDRIVVAVQSDKARND